MHSFRALIALAILVSAAKADDIWRTTKGESVNGHLSAIYGSYAVISQEEGSSVVPLALLGDADLGRVADFQAAQPAVTPKWKDSTAPLSRVLRGELDCLRHGALDVFNVGDRAEPEFYMIYFGGAWSQPSHEFSAQLVEAYNGMQQAAPGRFEVIYVSMDRDELEQVQGVRDMQMPWPVLRYHEVDSIALINRWRVEKVPSLVVLTRSGELVFHSNPEGSAQNNATQVLHRTEMLVESMTSPNELRRESHRLAVIQHLRAAGARTVAPQPYLIAVDPAKVASSDPKQVIATLDVDDAGHVTHAAFDPALDEAAGTELTSEARQWLFLPALQNGRPLAMRVKVPLQLKD
jgi:hypothetical protein